MDKPDFNALVPIKQQAGRPLQPTTVLERHDIAACVPLVRQLLPLTGPNTFVLTYLTDVGKPWILHDFELHGCALGKQAHWYDVVQPVRLDVGVLARLRCGRVLCGEEMWRRWRWR